MSTSKSFCRVLLPPIIALSLCGVLTSAAICRGDEGDNDAQAAGVPVPAAPVAAPPVAVEVDVAPAQPADEQPAKEQPAQEQPAKEQPAKETPAEAEPAEAEAAEPQPVGKLQIRKGTGRPPGLPAIARPATAVEVGEIVGLVPDVIVEKVDEQELEKEIAEHRQRLLAQLRPLLHRELYFVHLVCDTTAQERKQLLAVGESELTKLATSAAKREVPRVPQVAAGFVADGMIMDMPAAAPAPEAEANKKIQDSLLQAAAKELGEQRTDLLRNELKQRTDAQRRGTVNSLIAQLDAFLVLSSQQQEELGQRLLAGWREDWKSITQNIDSRYLPEMHLPPAAVMVLSEDQRKRFNAIPRVSFHIHEQPGVADPAAKPDRWKVALDQLDRAERSSGGKP